MTTLKVKTNLRCGACVQSIRPLFDAEPGVKHWAADVSVPDKVLTIEGDGVSVATVGGLLRQKGYRVLGEVPAEAPTQPPAPDPAEPAGSAFGVRVRHRVHLRVRTVVDGLDVLRAAPAARLARVGEPGALGGCAVQLVVAVRGEELQVSAAASRAADVLFGHAVPVPRRSPSKH